MELTNEEESRHVFNAVALQLKMASRLAVLQNSIAPVVEVRRKIPAYVKIALGLVDIRPAHPPTNHCPDCNKVISLNKIRCLECYSEFLEKQNKATEKDKYPDMVGL